MMKYFCAFIFSLFVFSLHAQFDVGEMSFSHLDPSRSNRDVFGQIYYPATSAGLNAPMAIGEFPVLVFGHGFTIDISEYEVWWEELVACGYVMIFPETEGGTSPDHGEFGTDLSFLVDTYIDEDNDPTSFFFDKLLNKYAVMGHSMGGGCTFLAAEQNTNIVTMISLAAAETTPSAIGAASNISIPTLTMAGSLDCVTPPSAHQIPMYNNLQSSYKAYLEIINGSHCQFGEASFFSACTFGENLVCGGTVINFIPIVDQHQQMLFSAKNWLNYYLLDDCQSFDDFHDNLTMSMDHTYMESGTDGCTCVNILNAPGTVISGTYQAAQTVQSDGTLAANSVVEFLAGNYICLDNDFEIPLGSSFEGIITGCP